MEPNCVICFNLLSSPARLDPCGHTFCEKCVGDWFLCSETCPVCKEKAVFIHSHKGRREVIAEKQVLKTKKESQLPKEVFEEEIGILGPRIEDLRKRINTYRSMSFSERLDDTLYYCLRSLESQLEKFTPDNVKALSEDLAWTQGLILELESALGQRDFEALEGIADRCEEEYLEPWEEEWSH